MAVLDGLNKGGVEACAWPCPYLQPSSLKGLVRSTSCFATCH